MLFSLLLYLSTGTASALGMTGSGAPAIINQTLDHNWAIRFGSHRYGVIETSSHSKGWPAPLRTTRIFLGTYSFPVRLSAITVAAIAFLVVSTLFLLARILNRAK
jgi:hypothetical protein